MDVLQELLEYATSDDILHTIHSVMPIDEFINIISHTFGAVWVFNGNRTFRNSKKHSYNDVPFIESKHDYRWYKNGLLDRDNGPAMIRNNSNFWYKKGLKHRLDGPAVYSKYERNWYIDGVLHRLDGPAIEHENGGMVWVINGKYERYEITKPFIRIGECAPTGNGSLDRTASGDIVIVRDDLFERFNNGELEYSEISVEELAVLKYRCEKSKKLAKLLALREGPQMYNGIVYYSRNGRDVIKARKGMPEYAAASVL